MYTVTLSDGTQIENLVLNGNNYISKTKLTEADFEGKLSHVTISDGTVTEEYDNMELIQVVQYGDEYWFILAESTPSGAQDKETRQIFDALLGGVS